eukprot:CAMPEP_0183335714 /NCGR_PEP_ID=MMETSP0164_2-20130417/3926_2 /TAXON_ID=221442 /ORGANISM="Coccolithus pelagicus ssp braarudi, Strain PLY182g" /LENGTH=106 /DNA_ID=CAMNT_0025505117 /DNA_START=409 /DNA_END=729 /DNA_ORIENTATION=-
MALLQLIVQCAHHLLSECTLFLLLCAQPHQLLRVLSRQLRYLHRRCRLCPRPLGKPLLAQTPFLMHRTSQPLHPSVTLGLAGRLEREDRHSLAILGREDDPAPPIT